MIERERAGQETKVGERQRERQHRKEERTSMGKRFFDFLGRKRGYGKVGFEK